MSQSPEALKLQGHLGHDGNQQKWNRITKNYSVAKGRTKACTKVEDSRIKKPKKEAGGFLHDRLAGAHSAHHPHPTPRDRPVVSLCNTAVQSPSCRVRRFLHPWISTPGKWWPQRGRERQAAGKDSPGRTAGACLHSVLHIVPRSRPRTYCSPLPWRCF